MGYVRVYMENNYINVVDITKKEIVAVNLEYLTFFFFFALTLLNFRCEYERPNARHCFNFILADIPP